MVFCWCADSGQRLMLYFVCLSENLNMYRASHLYHINKLWFPKHAYRALQSVSRYSWEEHLLKGSCVRTTKTNVIVAPRNQYRILTPQAFRLKPTIYHDTRRHWHVRVANTTNWSYNLCFKCCKAHIAMNNTKYVS